MKSAHLRDTAGSRRQLTAAKFGRSNLLYEALSYLKFFTHLKNKKKITWGLFRKKLVTWRYSETIFD